MTNDTPSQPDFHTQTLYYVVKNHEEQYSIWPSFKEIPAGWSTVGEKDTKEKCLEIIEVCWTDIRPKSLREKMAKAS